MADFLPRLDDFIPGYSDPLPPVVRKAPAPAPAKPGSAYEALTPEQKKQADLLLEPRSALGEIGTGLIRGAAYELPKLVGQAMQAPGNAGDTLYDWGTKLQDFTKGNNARFLEDQNPEAHNFVTENLAKGAAMLAPSLAPLAIMPFLPEAAAVVGAGALGGTLFGASQFTETWDKAIKAGKTPEEARHLALQTAAIEGGGEAIATPILGRFIRGAGSMFGGRKLTVQGAVDALKNPKFLTDLGKLTAETATVETATEVGQAYGEAKVEKDAGIASEDPYHAATAAIGPTLAMTALLTPLGARGLHRQQSRNKALVDQATLPDPELNPYAQLAKVDRATRELQPTIASMTTEQDAKQWALDQLEKTVKDQNVQQQALYEDRQQKAQERTAAAAEQTRVEQETAQALRQQELAASGEVDQSGVRDIAGNQRRVNENMTEAERMSATGVPGVRQEPLRDTLTPTQYEGMWADLLQQRDVAGFDQQAQADLPAAVGRVRAPQDAALAAQGVAAQRTEADRQAAVAQAIVNPPAGALTFGQFTAETMKSRRAKDGELALKGGKLNESSLRDAYSGYMNNFLYTPKEEQAQQQVQVGTSEGQGTLPLEMSQEVGSDTRPAAYQVPAAGVQRTNMTEAMFRANRQKVLADVAAEAEAKKQEELDKLTNIGRGSRMADLAEAGQITGNTPLQFADLQTGWAETAKAKGMEPTAVIGDKRTLINNAFEKAAGQKLFAAQLTTLRKARDQLPKNSEARDSLDAFVTRLEGNKNVQAQVTTEKTQGAESQRAQVQVPGNGQQRNEGNAAPVAQAQGNNQGQVKASDLIPETEKRVLRGRADSQGSLRNYRFAFENYKYNATVNPTEPINQSWLTDYDLAYKLAAGLNQFGEEQKKSERSEKEQRNAKEALKWLELRNPDIEEKVKVVRARLKGIMDVNKRGRDQAQDALTKLAKQINYEYTRRLGKNIEDLTPAERAEMQQDYDEVVNSSPAYRNSFNKNVIDGYRYDVNIEVAVHTGDVESVLQAVELSPYAGWAQPLVDRLRALNLQTTIRAGLETVPGASEKNRRGAAGLHSHSADWIGIGEKGYSVHTVLHELTHAATSGRVQEGVYASQIPKARRTNVQQAAYADVVELQDLVAAVYKALPATEIFEHTNTEGQLFGKLYGLTNEREFLAEVRSNVEFQNRLRQLQDKEGRNLWQRVKDWFSGILGRPADPVFDNVLEHALLLAERFETGSRFDLWNHINEGPQVDALRVDSLLQTASSEWEKAQQKFSMLGNAGQVTTRAMLKGFTTHHIQEWYAKSPSLKMISNGFKAITKAGDVKSKMVQDKAAEFDQPARTLMQILHGNPVLQKEVSILGSEMSGLNIDLNKDYAANLVANPTLERSTQMKAYVNDLHARYKNLLADVKAPLEQTFAVNRKNFIQQTVTSLRNYLSTFSDARTGQWLSRLDIQDPSLNQGAPLPVTQGKLPYYLDRYTANLDARLQTILKEISDAKLGKEFHEIQQFYSAAVGNPYQHLARVGSNFVEFTLKPTPEALARVQQALAPFNVVIGQPNKDNQHVFMRFENPAQRDQAEAVMRTLDGVATEPGTVRGGSLENRGDIDRSRGVPQFARGMIQRLDETFGASVQGRTPQETALIEEMHQSIKRWALDAIPDTSARKALAQRNVGGRTLGYEADFVRNFTTRAVGMAHNLANAYALPLFSKAFAQMQQEIAPLAGQNAKLHSEAQMVYDELAQRVANTMNRVESPIVDGINAFGYGFYLALSPAFLLTNLVQPYHLTLPYLGGHYGFIQSAKAMGSATGKALAVVQDTLQAGIAAGKAVGGVGGALLGALDARMVMGSSKLNVGEVAFIHALAAADQLEGSTQARDLSQMAAGVNPALIATAKFASAAAHYTEVVNRLTAGLAGYNLELARSGDVGKATALGIKAVVDTQFNYSERNKASALGRHGVAGKITPLLSSFQSYSFQTTELLIRMVRDATFAIPATATAEQRAELQADRAAAQKGLAGILGTTTLIAGTLGLPFANVAARILDAVLETVGADDDAEKRRLRGGGGDFGGAGASGSWGDGGTTASYGNDNPSDVKSAYRSWLAQWAGKDVAEALARGVPRALLGLDTSSRAGLQDILPGSRFFTDRRAIQDKIKDGALNMLGPAVNAGVDLTTGMSHMFDGRVMDGLTEMLPLALRGPAKAFKMSQVGYTNATGNQIPIPVTGWDEFVQSLGFTPSKKAEQSEANFALKTRDALLKAEKAKLSNKMYLAIEREGNLSGEQLQALNDWNVKNPQYKIDLKAGLEARAKARGVAEISGTEIDALPRYLPILERYQYAVTR